jgi:hypothetical protein
VNKLIELNPNLKANPNLIYVGWLLTVKSDGSVAQQPTAQTVKAGLVYIDAVCDLPNNIIRAFRRFILQDKSADPGCHGYIEFLLQQNSYVESSAKISQYPDGAEGIARKAIYSEGWRPDSASYRFGLSTEELYKVIFTKCAPTTITLGNINQVLGGIAFRNCLQNVKSNLSIPNKWELTYTTK